ncbi:hypothetical protein BRADI_4g24220v3, partial [Brachypodium distachyon]
DAYSSNLVFSPLSIYITLDELLRLLGVSSQSELYEFLPRAAALIPDRSATGGPRVASACGVWSDLSCPLNPGFVESVVSGSENTEMAAVDFRGDAKGACRRINAWAARVTHGLIDGVLGPDSVTEETLVLGNAVYFKGRWGQPFNKRRTIVRPFRRLGGAGEVEVPFMRSRKPQFVALHRGFKPSFMCDHLPRRRVDVGKFRVPRFKLSFHDSLVAVLRQPGLVLPFSNVADFSDMAGCPIKLDEVVHKAVLEVNEEGTKAAAVTIVRGLRGCAPRAKQPPPPRVDFVADHPFAYFVVEENTGTVVFNGHVVDPYRHRRLRRPRR